MILSTLERCPLCQSPDIAPFKKGTVVPERIGPADFRITDSHYGSRWSLFSCRDCAFVFANPAPAGGEIERFYAALADDEYSQEDAGRGRNFSAILGRLRRFAPPGAALLDVGAASGIFLNLARSAGYRVSGIEPSAALVADAQRLYGLRLFCGTLEQFKSAEKFAVVTLLDVLEHVPHPNALLATLNGLMAPGGWLVIVTPDIHSLAARVMGGRWWHYRIAHIHFFNLRSLDWVLRENGFAIVMRKRFAWNFSLYYLLTRLWPGCKGASLQKILKKIHCKLQLFDSWEIYARKKS
jgi:SAM-dependent methyltransferase